ncbi:MAG: hypothetical protein AB9869_08235 [Verrucomicrobiia bacterium]
MSWLQDQKDSTVSFVLEKVLRKKVERYGRLVEFKLDSRSAQASITLALHGEADPVTIWIDEYHLISHRDGTSVSIAKARTSREWLTLLVQDFLLGRAFPIPAEYASYVKLVL